MPIMLIIGKLRHRVEIQQAVETRDEATMEVLRDWVNFAWRYAEIKPQTGRQYDKGDINKAQNTYKVTMRFVPGMNALMRVRYGTRIFTIKVVQDYDEIREFQIVYCTELTT